MNLRPCLFILAFLGVAAIAPPADAAPSTPNTLTLAETLCRHYEAINTLSCEIRKTTKNGLRTMRMLSRVHYKRPDHLHVDNVSPVKRTIIADGDRLYYHEASLDRGFSRPISELSDTWLKPLRNIPGTALEHLLPLNGLPETKLPASAHAPLRRGYKTDSVYVVLSVDNQHRLLGIDFFKTPAMEDKTGEYAYSRFHQVTSNCWIPTYHKATLFLPTDKVVETRHIRNLTVNAPIPEHLFNHELFMEDVEFVDTFRETY